MVATILYLNTWPGDLVQKLKTAGMGRYAGARGWSVESVPCGDSQPGKIRGILAAHAPIAGCIVEGSDDNVRLPPSLFGKIPVVYLQASPTLFGGRIARIGVDNEAIARAAFHELSSGHPVGYAVVGNCVGFEWAIARERAFAALAAEAGAECRVFAMRCGKPGEPSGKRAAALAEWVAALPCHTAVFAVHDYCAAEIVAAARAVHRLIPQELTLCGVDNLTDVCEASHPTITSIQLDHERAGFLAAKMIGDIAAAKYTNNRKSLANSAFFAAKREPATVGPLLAVRRKSTRGSGRREPFILEAVEIIRSKACEGLTAAKLAAHFPCSRSLFYLRFREAMGHSVLDEILNVRFEKVFTLLSQTDTPIGAIADFCGFRSAIALKWIFRKRTGMSMREWRARNFWK